MTNFKLNEKHAVTIPSGGVYLDGLLYIPKDACGLVLFVHGSGSSRFSVRNQYVASVLNEVGLATLLIVGRNDEVVIQLILRAQYISLNASTNQPHQKCPARRLWVDQSDHAWPVRRSS